MIAALHDRVTQIIDDILAQHPDAPLAYMDDAELAATIARDGAARTSLAIEGMVLTDDEEMLFTVFDERRYAHATRRWLILAYLDYTEARQPEPVPAATAE